MFYGCILLDILCLHLHFVCRDHVFYVYTLATAAVKSPDYMMCIRLVCNSTKGYVDLCDRHNYYDLLI